MKRSGLSGREVASLASKRKVILVYPDPGTRLVVQDFNSLPDDILLSLAHMCEIDMDSLNHEHKKNFTLLGELDDRQGEMLVVTIRGTR